MTEPPPILKAVGVSRIYVDGGIAAVSQVDLMIARGEYVAIMGPSGSGKSTLLNLLGGLDRPTEGEILFEGTSLADLGSLDEYRAQRVGFVFQSFYLLPALTALENVQIPMFEGPPLSARGRTQRAMELLADVGMVHRAGHLPQQLSVGERQRVAIARALANGPSLLLADEPTGNLDSTKAREIFDLFDALHERREMTIVLVTHDHELAGRARRLVLMRDGRIISAGPPAG